MTFYEGTTICLGLLVIVQYIKAKRLTESLYRTTYSLHMVGLGKWTIKASEKSLTVFDDEGDKRITVNAK
jgi:hypothetical protein